MNKRWIYVSDMTESGATTIFDPESKELRQINQGHVKNRGRIGLRYAELEEVGGGMYAETGTFATPTAELIAEAQESYRARNQWMVDWPHMQLELEDYSAERTALADMIKQRMGLFPYEFEIIGLERRYLFYYSDGSHESQKYFAGLAPQPAASPFRWDGTLQRKYRPVWSSEARDKKVPYPKEWEGAVGARLRPVMYYGPAYVLRFLLDGQDVAFGHTHVYVKPNGDFIGSDWCQRHDYSSYHGGINLQLGIQTVESWITNSCVIRAQQQGVFKPTSVVFKSYDVRSLLEDEDLVVVPSFEEAFEIAVKQQESENKDPLSSRIKTLAKGGDLDAAFSALATELEAARAGNQAAMLVGLPFFVTKPTMKSATADKELPKSYDLKHTTTPNVYGFRAESADDSDTQVAWRIPRIGFEARLYPNTLAIDWQTAEPMLRRRLQDAADLEAMVTTADAGEITPEVMEEARLAAERLELAAQLDDQQTLISEAFRFAIGQMPVEADFAFVDSTNTENAKAISRARFTPQPDGSVVLAWIAGRYAHPDKVFRCWRDTGSEGSAYFRVPFHRPKALVLAAAPEKLVVNSPPWRALEWYYTGVSSAVVPNSETAAPKPAPVAPTKAAETFNYFDVPFVVVQLDADTINITNTATKESANVTRGKNGHPYIVIGDQRFAVEAGFFREAVLEYFRLQEELSATAA